MLKENYFGKVLPKYGKISVLC